MTIAIRPSELAPRRSARPISSLLALEVEFDAALEEEGRTADLHDEADEAETEARRELPTCTATTVVDQDVMDGIAGSLTVGDHFNCDSIERLKAFSFQRFQREERHDGYSLHYGPMPTDQRERIEARIREILAGLAAFYTAARTARLKALKAEERRRDRAFTRAYTRLDQLTAKIVRLPATTPREVAVKLKALRYQRGLRRQGGDIIGPLFSDTGNPLLPVLASMAADLVRIVAAREAA